MRRRARTDLCGGRVVRTVPTATVTNSGANPARLIDISHTAEDNQDFSAYSLNWSLEGRLLAGECELIHHHAVTLVNPYSSFPG